MSDGRALAPVNAAVWPPMSVEYPDDAALVAGLRAGEEDAFVQLLDRYHRLLVRVARRFVASDDTADEVVAETWLVVIRGIHTFEGRSTLKTWLVRILTNRAISQGVRDARQTPFSSLAGDDVADDRGGFPENQFVDQGPFGGHWIAAGTVRRWGESPLDQVVAREMVAVVHKAAAALPDAQRAVFTLRDIEGWTSDEVIEALGLTAANQRVLLHRGRARVRTALDRYDAGMERR